MANTKVIIASSDAATSTLLERTLSSSGDIDLTVAGDIDSIEPLIRKQSPDLLILDQGTWSNQGEQPENVVEFAVQLFEQHPALPIILLANELSQDLLRKALHAGITDILQPPVQTKELVQTVQHAVQRKKRLQDWIQLETKRNTRSLQERVEYLETLQRIGRSITAFLDLDTVLSAVVEAAVESTGAEEGSLLLLDETSGELTMRAARNFGEDFVRTFRLPVTDTLPGEVMRTKKPIVIDEQIPKKIKTAYLVHTLIYVPLMLQDRAIGVLGVDNRRSGHTFSDYHVALVSALADYAVIAIENARLYASAEIERNKLGSILTRITDSVIVIDQEGRVVLINDSARKAFKVTNDDPIDKSLQEVISSTDLIEVLTHRRPSQPYRSEIVLEDDQVLNVHITPIPELGFVATMQDITRMKQLDKIKSEFVSTVSHDLRSPLTAILGYVELIERVGPVNDLQKDFIRRVGMSVHSITSLINDLLDLGRIEAGFEVRNELVPMESLIIYTVENFQERLTEKNLVIQVDVQEDLPELFGNPNQLRQMLSNLLGNALKYTPAGGQINIHAEHETGQIILRFQDTGVGIPLADQPYIFDKFYRASNVPSDVLGTGLGLSIVKSIVDNHHGRVWLDSAPGQGSTFTVVLPIEKRTSTAFE